MRPTAYDYTSYVLRTDPVHQPPAGATDPAAATALDFAAAQRGELTATVPVITDIWAQVSPDPAALAAMLAVLDGFVAHAQTAGHTTWHDVTPETITGFVRDPDPALGDDARRLRKNTVHGAYLALTDAGLRDDDSPAEGVDPVPGQLRRDERGKRLGNPKSEKLRRSYASRIHVRPASHDEILIIRVASRLAGTSRTQHLAAAAVAICSASATTTEAPHVRWADLDTTGEHATMQCIGRDPEPGREETAIAARRVTLDTWSTAAVTAWQQERGGPNAHAPAVSVLYTGHQPLSSNSAQVGTDQQVRKALQIADLRREPGLTAGSLRLWAAAKHVRSFTTLADGAATAGIDPLTLHRHITQQGDRGLRLNH